MRQKSKPAGAQASGREAKRPRRPPLNAADCVTDMLASRGKRA
jgi:hypothetical protein